MPEDGMFEYEGAWGSRQTLGDTGEARTSTRIVSRTGSRLRLLLDVKLLSVDTPACPTSRRGINWGKGGGTSILFEATQPMSETDTHKVSELICKARDGDDQCRDQLFEICRSYLGFAARAQVESWLRVKVDASDLVQQTMLEAHRDFEKFQGSTEQEWLGWLRRILAHNVSDFIRRYKGTAKRRVQKEVPFRDPNVSGPSPGAPEPAATDRTPSQELALLDDSLRVTQALSALAPDYQEVIVLRNLERLSFNDVAERMNRSRPAVQMLWMRAIKKLQETLGEEEPE